MRAVWVALGLGLAGVAFAPTAEAGCAPIPALAVCPSDTDGDGTPDHVYASTLGTNACVWLKTWAPNCRASTPAGTTAYQALHSDDRTAVTVEGSHPVVAYRVLAYDYDTDGDGHRETYAQFDLSVSGVVGTGYGTGCEPGAGRVGC